jgi:hypothetical protein
LFSATIALLKNEIMVESFITMIPVDCERCEGAGDDDQPQTQRHKGAESIRIRQSSA